MEQLPTNAVSLICRLVIDEAMWDPSAFSKSRDRLLAGDVPSDSHVVLQRDEVTGLLPIEHAVGRRRPDLSLRPASEWARLEWDTGHDPSPAR